MISTKTFGVLLILTLSIPVYGQRPVPPLLPVGEVGVDLTSSFEELLPRHSDNSGFELPADLYDAHVLFVPGFFSDHSPFYFRAQRQWLRSVGISVEIVGSQWGFDGENLPVRNALSVAAAIRQAPEDVVLVSHSKGSVEVLMALLAYPELRPKVRGWLAIQSLFFGSPVADKLFGSRFGERWSEFIGYFGDVRTLETLTELERSRYIERHEKKIAELVQDVNLISFASWEELSEMDHLLRAIVYLYGREMEERFPQGHDGLIPVPHSILPGSPYIIAGEMDHAKFILNRRSRIPNRAILAALFELLFRTDTESAGGDRQEELQELGASGLADAAQ